MSAGIASSGYYTVMPYAELDNRLKLTGEIGF